jgi:hypothetical protein
MTAALSNHCGWYEGEGEFVFPVAEPLVFQTMATAIIIIPTYEGFVIAADRRRKQSSTDVFADDVTKIVHIDGSKLALAVSGAVQLTKSETSIETAFDFRDAITMAVREVEPSDPFSLRKYVRLSCAHVISDLEHVKATETVEPYPSGTPSDPGLIANAFFVGYYKGRPSLVRARIKHADQHLLEPDVIEAQLYIGLITGYGSAAIIQRLNDSKDQALAAYRDNLEPDERTLKDAVRTAANYFRACSDPDVQQLDEQHCLSLSPKINIATIKPSEGFQWVIGPDETN